MNKIDIFSYGWIYDVMLGLLAVGVVIDAFSIVKCLKAGKEDIQEYAQLCIKYLKLILYFAAGVFFLIICFTYGLDTVTSAIHGVLGAMLLIDGIVSLIIKLKYTVKPVK